MKKNKMETQELNFGTEQIMKEVEGDSFPVGLKFFVGKACFEFPGLAFSNICEINTDPERNLVEVKIAFGPTIKMRTDGWCKWE